MTSHDTQALLERLRFMAEHGLFVASQNGMAASYTEAADTIEALSSALSAAERERDVARGAFALADEISCAAIEHGFYVGDGLLEQLANFRAALPAKQEKAE